MPHSTVFIDPLVELLRSSELVEPVSRSISPFFSVERSVGPVGVDPVNGVVEGCVWVLP